MWMPLALAGLFITSIVPLVASAQQHLASSAPTPAVANVSRETANSIQGVLGDTLENLVAVDIEDVRDHIRAEDQRRLSGETDFASLVPLKSNFHEDWEMRYTRTFSYRIAEAEIPYRLDPASSGREVLVTIPADGSLPEVRLRLVNEGTFGEDWRIDAPDSLHDEGLKRGLQAAYLEVQKERNRWGNNIRRGYASTARHFLRIFGLPDAPI